MRIDLGDAVLETRLIIKGHRLQLFWHIGAAIESTAKGQPGPHNWYPTTGKADVSMDLMADKQVSLTLQFTDEMGNPTDDEPGSVNATFTVDRTDLINLTDNGNGSAVAAAVGPLGMANVHVDVVANGQSLSGDLQVNVVSGLAERVNLVAGEPEEVSPDV